MSFESTGLHAVGLECDADFSAKQYYFAKMSTTDKRVSVCTADGEVPLGIIQNDPDTAGQAVDIMLLGQSKVICGETIVAGDLIGTDSNGKARKVEKTNTGADIGDTYVGIAVTGGAANEIISVILGISGRVESA